MAIYENGVLCASKIEEVICQKGMNEFTSTMTVPENYALENSHIKLFVWTKKTGGSSVVEYLGYLNGDTEIVKPQNFTESVEATSVNLRYSINNSERKIIINGNIVNPKDKQELTISALDSDKSVIVLEEIYPDNRGNLSAVIPFSESAKGGNISVYVGGKGGIDETYTLYYVNSDEEKNIISLLNTQTSPSDLKTKIDEYIDMDIIDYNWFDDDE